MKNFIAKLEAALYLLMADDWVVWECSETASVRRRAVYASSREAVDECKDYLNDLTD